MAARRIGLLAGLLAMLAVQELAQVARVADAYCIFNGGNRSFTFYQQPVVASGFKVALRPGEWACCGWYNNDCNLNDGACGITGFGIQEGYEDVDSVTRGIIVKEVFTYLSYALTAPLLLPFEFAEIPLISMEALLSSLSSAAMRFARGVEEIVASLSELGHAASFSEFAAIAGQKAVSALSYMVEASINRAVSQLFGISGSTDLLRGAFRALGVDFTDAAAAVKVSETALVSADTTSDAVAATGFINRVKGAYRAGQASVDGLKAEAATYAENLARQAGMSEQRIAQFRDAARSYLEFSDKYYSVSDQLNTIRLQIRNAKRGYNNHTRQRGGADNTQTNAAARAPGTKSEWTRYATQASQQYSAGVLQVPNAAFITIDIDNTIQWCWQVYSCDGSRDFMVESGVINGQTDIDSRGGGHRFDRDCFMGCLINGMDAFGNTDRPSWLYRRSQMGPFDHDKARDGPNGCCNVVLQSLQNSMQLQMDGLTAKRNATTANKNALKRVHNEAIAAMKQMAPMCFITEMTEYMGCYRDDGDTRMLSHGADGNDNVEQCYDQTSDAHWFPTARNTPRTSYTNYYTYFGVQAGGECYMSSSIRYRAGVTGYRVDGLPGPNSRCDRVCGVNLTVPQIDIRESNSDRHLQYCGGSWAMQTYRRRSMEVFSANYSYIGCYRDITRSSANNYHGSHEDVNAPGDAYDRAAIALRPPMNHVLPFRVPTKWQPNYGSWNYVPSVQACADLAMDLGYPYFGLEVGDECWLGFDLARAKSRGAAATGQCQSKNCDYNYPGTDPRKMSPDSCGNRQAHVIALYQVISPPRANPSPRASPSPTAPRASPSQNATRPPTVIG